MSNSACNVPPKFEIKTHFLEWLSHQNAREAIGEPIVSNSPIGVAISFSNIYQNIKLIISENNFSVFYINKNNIEESDWIADFDCSPSLNSHKKYICSFDSNQVEYSSLEELYIERSVKPLVFWLLEKMQVEAVILACGVIGEWYAVLVQDKRDLSGSDTDHLLFTESFLNKKL